MLYTFLGKHLNTTSFPDEEEVSDDMLDTELDLLSPGGNEGDDDGVLPQAPSSSSSSSSSSQQDAPHTQQSASGSGCSGKNEAGDGIKTMIGDVEVVVQVPRLKEAKRTEWKISRKLQTASMYQGITQDLHDSSSSSSPAAAAPTGPIDSGTVDILSYYDGIVDPSPAVVLLPITPIEPTSTSITATGTDTAVGDAAISGEEGDGEHGGDGVAGSGSSSTVAPEYTGSDIDMYILTEEEQQKK